MMKIGLISDTHGYINTRLIKFFEYVDEIWHAGDIGSIEVFDKLQKIKSVKAVYGNIDNYKIRQCTNEFEIFSVAQQNIWMTHIGGYPGNYAPTIKKKLQHSHPDIIISGHSHILKVIYDKKHQLLHLNPGAAGPIGIHKVSTAIRFDINNKGISNLEILEFPRAIRSESFLPIKTN